MPDLDDVFEENYLEEELSENKTVNGLSSPLASEESIKE